MCGGARRRRGGEAVTNPVTWAEIEEALGNGGARRVFDEHRNRIEHTEPCSNIGINNLVAVECLARAELWLLREELRLQWARWGDAQIMNHIGIIRTVRERLEREVYGE